MRNNYIDVIQKCICIDCILNILIDSPYNNHIKILSTIKDENQRNIKIMIYLYESYHQDTITIENIIPIQLKKPHINYVRSLIQYNLQAINGLKNLERFYSNSLYKQLLNSLKSSYFNFISLLSCFFSTHKHKFTYSQVRENDLDLIHFIKLNNNGFNLLNSTPNIVTLDNISYEVIRNISLDAINIFFNCNLDDNSISEEHYEIFFKNNPENKFYQLFFKSQDKVFKIRILEKDLTVFYIYQSNSNPIKSVPSITQDEAKVYAQSFLYNKLGKSYKMLEFDDNYLNVYSYMNLPEYYKFKYSIIDSTLKPSYNKNLYITVDSTYIYICELQFL